MEFWYVFTFYWLKSVGIYRRGHLMYFQQVQNGNIPDCTRTFGLNSSNPTPLHLPPLLSMSMSYIEIDFDDDEFISFTTLTVVHPSITPGDEEDYTMQLHRCQTGNNRRELSWVIRHSELQYYFAEGLLYKYKNFKSHFCMPKTIYNRTCDALIKNGLLKQRIDPAKKPGIYPRMRIIATLPEMACSKPMVIQASCLK